MVKFFNTPTNNHRKRWIIIAIVAVVLIGGGVGGYFYWTTTQNNNNSQNTPTPEKLSDDALPARINTLIDEEKYDEALALIEHQDGATTDPAKITLLARVYADKGEADKALKLLDDSIERDSDNAYFYTGNKARITAEKGDTQGAIDLYKKAISLGEAMNVTDDAASSTLNQRIGDYYWEVEQLEAKN